MSLSSIVFAEIERIAEQLDLEVPPLRPELSLTETGLDSLALAILVARLEERLGVDPFSEADEQEYPVTLGDLVRLYEHAAQQNKLDPVAELS